MQKYAILEPGNPDRGSAIPAVPENVTAQHKDINATRTVGSIDIDFGCQRKFGAFA